MLWVPRIHLPWVLSIRFSPHEALKLGVSNNKTIQRVLFAYAAEVLLISKDTQGLQGPKSRTRKLLVPRHGVVTTRPRLVAFAGRVSRSTSVVCRAYEELVHHGKKEVDLQVWVAKGHHSKSLKTPVWPSLTQRRCELVCL